MDHGRCAPPDGDAQSSTTTALDRIWRGHAEALSSLSCDEADDLTCLLMKAPVTRENQWHVADSLEAQLVEIWTVVVQFLPAHCFATIVSGTSRVRRTDPNVQGRPTAWEGCAGKDVGGAESWSTGDEFGGLGHRGSVDEMAKIKLLISHPIMTTCTFS